MNQFANAIRAADVVTIGDFVPYVSTERPDRIWSENAPEIARRSETRSRSKAGDWLFMLYRIRRMRGLVRRLCNRIEGPPIWSYTLRRILNEYHGVEIGKYTYGDVLVPGLLPAGTSVGAYCSVGSGLVVRRRNHPLDRPILHPFFYNKDLKLVRRDTIPTDRENPLTIGNDVWIGDRVTILSGCRRIGNGAVIAAGAVVSKDVEPYALVGGVPARTIRMRFDRKRIAEIERSAWWNQDIASLIEAPPFTDIFGGRGGFL